MPTAEFIKSRRTARKIASPSNHLRVFILYSCPVCKRYTIHAPRASPKGFYYVDHRRVPVYRKDSDGRKKLVGLAPDDACFVDSSISIWNIEQTRAVIRVK